MQEAPTLTAPVAKQQADSRTRRAEVSRVCVLVACLLIIYAPVLTTLVRQWWNEPDYSHGFLVPLFSAYLLWRRRDELRQVPRNPSWIGMLLLCASLCVLFVGSLGAELFLQRISLLGVIAGLVIWLCGEKILRTAAFPLALLLLMIPLPGVIYYQLVIPLQALASQLAASFLHAINLFPIHREGNVIVLSSMSLEVSEACSGIRSVFSLLTITAIYAYLAERDNLIRWMLCLMTFPIAVAGNAGRVVFAAISAELAGASAVEGWSHFLSGLFLFFFSTLLIVLSHAILVGIRHGIGACRRPA